MSSGEMSARSCTRLERCCGLPHSGKIKKDREERELAHRLGSEYKLTYTNAWNTHASETWKSRHSDICQSIYSHDAMRTKSALFTQSGHLYRTLSDEAHPAHEKIKVESSRLQIFTQTFLDQENKQNTQSRHYAMRKARCGRGAQVSCSQTKLLKPIHIYFQKKESVGGTATQLG